MIVLTSMVSMVTIYTMMYIVFYPAPVLAASFLIAVKSYSNTSSVLFAGIIFLIVGILGIMVGSTIGFFASIIAIVVMLLCGGVGASIMLVSIVVFSIGASLLVTV